MKVDIRQTIRSGSLWRGEVETPSLYAMEMLERKLTQYARKATAPSTPRVRVQQAYKRTFIDCESHDARVSARRST